MGVAKKQKGHGDTLLWAAVGLLNIQRETAALKNQSRPCGYVMMAWKCTCLSAAFFLFCRWAD